MFSKEQNLILERDKCERRRHVGGYHGKRLSDYKGCRLQFDPSGCELVGTLEGYPAVYELINEVIPIIRKSNPWRTIIVGPEYYQQIFALENLKLPGNERNLIVAIHCYLPVEFTHQGASYVPGLENLKDVHWKGTAVASTGRRSAV